MRVERERSDKVEKREHQNLMRSGIVTHESGSQKIKNREQTKDSWCHIFVF